MVLACLAPIRRPAACPRDPAKEYVDRWTCYALPTLHINLKIINQIIQQNDFLGALIQIFKCDRLFG